VPGAPWRSSGAARGLRGGGAPSGGGCGCQGGGLSKTGAMGGKGQYMGDSWDEEGNTMG